MTKIDTQPKALRLADWLEEAATTADMGRKPLASDHRRRAAAELRRLHAENAAQAQQIAQDRADAARLDFIGRHIGGGLRLDDRKAVSSDYIYWGEYRGHKTLRTAIDAAIAARAAASGAAQGDDHAN